MEELTSEQIATIFTNAGHSVTIINADASFSDYQKSNPLNTSTTETEWKEKIQRNVEHLEIIKEYKKLDETTSIWTTEDFTAIDAAIVAGKKLY